LEGTCKMKDLVRFCLVFLYCSGVDNKECSDMSAWSDLLLNRLAIRGKPQFSPIKSISYIPVLVDVSIAS